jgi:hypothetical protein
VPAGLPAQSVPAADPGVQQFVELQQLEQLQLQLVQLEQLQLQLQLELVGLEFVRLLGLIETNEG